MCQELRISGIMFNVQVSPSRVVPYRLNSIPVRIITTNKPLHFFCVICSQGPSWHSQEGKAQTKIAVSPVNIDFALLL
jgi:hypothetical protein